MLCLAGFGVPRVSGAALMMSGTTALLSCLQRMYLMRDTYQLIFAQYPALTAFSTVGADETPVIASLQRLLAGRGVTGISDGQSTAARMLAQSVTCMSDADAAGIKLEYATADLMERLLQITPSSDVRHMQELIKSSSLLSHVTAFVAEQSKIAALPPAPVAQRVVQFMPNQKGSTFLTLLKDESVDVIELNGTYHLPFTIIDIDRKRPVLVRPAPGATVVLSGSSIGADPQFWFGLGGRAGNIAMQGLIFDGFVLGQQGVVQARNCHDITLNDMVVRNSRANTALAQPYHSWAVYLDATPTIAPSNFTANHWTVECSARSMSGLQVRGGSHVTALDWSISNAWYAVYAIPSYGSITDFVLDNWMIANTGAPVWASSNASVYVENCSGRFSNMRATGSGALLNVGHPKMTDGGGNSMIVMPLIHQPGRMLPQF